ncbi:MAG: PIN domain-containing protein [Thermoplasmata archaeon]
MTESDLVFDTWAWWEVLHKTAVGLSLAERYFRSGKYRVHTSSISLGELSARLLIDGGTPEWIALMCGSIRRTSHLWDVTADIAQEAGVVRAQLREKSSSASLVDAIIYVTARKAGARIVSADPAFRGIPGVITR